MQQLDYKDGTKNIKMSSRVNPQQILSNLFAQHPIAPIIADWDTIMGPLAQLVRLEKIEKNAAILRVMHPALAQELNALSATLIARMNNRMQTPVISEIKIIMGAAYKRKNTRQQYSNKQPRVAKPLPSRVTLALERLDDQDLANALTAYFATCSHE